MKKVVVVGGGFAGAYVARNLERSFDVTLIDTKDYFEFTPSILRTLVEPQHMKKIQVRHSHYLHTATIVKGCAEHITTQEVHTEDGTYPYDYLVLCSGSRYNTPIKDENIVITARADKLRSYAQKLRKAHTVLVIGGGVVGVELAAEIIEAYPDKDVTVVHSKGELIDRNPQKARMYAQRFLEKRGVKIVFNERIVKNEGTSHITKSGKKYTADLTFLCVGITPNYEYMNKHCSTSLNERNYICVTPELQVEGYNNVFAAGDITNIPEEKTAQSAEKQAMVVVQNILSLEQGKSLKQYKPQGKPMLISLGKRNGIFVHNNFVVTGKLPGALKNTVEWKTMRRYR